ncbi:hypothetical protein D922_04400, partial [Enterococcus faecalis 06-MB-DW-09]
MVLAETVDETQNAEAQEVTLPYDNLLEAPTSAYSESQEEPTVEEALTFSLEKEAVAATVGETTDVVIHVDRPTDQVQVTIPKELTVQQDELTEGLEATQMTETEWLFTADERTKFTIPVSSETAGKFTIRVEDELDGTIDFEETEEDETNDKAVVTDNTDNTNEPEDSAISEVQEEEETPTQETEDITPATTSNVSTWAQYRTAINTASVTVINVMADISGNTSLNSINRNLTINGNGHTINSQGQGYAIATGNRQLTFRNATIVSQAYAVFGVSHTSGNATFVFSNINYDGDSLFVADGAVSASLSKFSTIIFDGGMSSLKSSSTLFANIDDIRITNNATVNLVDSVVANNFGGTASEKAERSKLTIEKGATLTAKGGSGVIFQNLNIEGDLDIKAPSFSTPSITSPILGTTLAPLNIVIGENAKVRVEHGSGSLPVIGHRQNGAVNLTIAKGAEYDFINTTVNAPVLTGTSSNIQINTENLAVWNRGMTNVISSSPSRNFKDLEAQLTGVNGSTISSTNHTEFRSAYSTEGLFGYSRISNSGIADENLLQLELEASPADGGNPSAGNTSLAEGSTTTIRANPNSGYNFVRWEIVSGAGNIANATLANTTFTMGASNTVVRAVYTPVPTTFTNTVLSNPFIGGRVRV